MNELYPVYTLKNECHDCYRCVRECHVKAIKIKNSHASVLDKKCIACGHCVKACPSNAKRIRYDIDKVKTLFIAQKKVIVSLAPTWAGVYDLSQNKIVALLKKLGFSAVSETALGAQEVSIKTAEMLKNVDNGLYISSACPVIVDYIRLYNPRFVQNITKLASPALTHAKMLKDLYGNDISVVFIGPCIAKKNESAKHPELIDVALTFEELNYWIKEEFINLAEIETSENDDFVPENSHEGALYPIEGGMNETIKAVGVSSDTQLLTISSLETFERALQGFEPNQTERKIFVEALGCDSGCINGPCVSTNKSGISINSDILVNVKRREVIPQTPAVVVETSYDAKPVENKIYPIEDIIKAMEKIGKYTEEDELNCGGCGYPTCRDLAGALLSGEAEPSMCVSYMRKIAMQKAAALLRCMPSAMVMVDNDLKIVETNEAFIKMFCGEMTEIFEDREEGLKGAYLEKIVNFGDVLKSALKTGKDIHKEHYLINKKLYDIIAFTVEKNAVVGAIITDVTQSEMNRGKIAQKAKDVISKNISTVQEIACLLGEHMVETELLLNSIAEDFDIQSNEDKK